MKTKIIHRLEFLSNSDTLNYELWVDPLTRIIYEVPIDRNFLKAAVYGRIQN